MVDDSVDHCSSDCLISKDAAPGREREIRREDQRRVLIAGRDELEEEVCCILVKWEISDLVDDEETIAAKPCDLLGQSPFSMGVCQPRHPLRCGAEEHAVTSPCCDDA